MLILLRSRSTGNFCGSVGHYHPLALLAHCDIDLGVLPGSYDSYCTVYCGFVCWLMEPFSTLDGIVLSVMKGHYLCS